MAGFKCQCLMLVLGVDLLPLHTGVLQNPTPGPWPQLTQAQSSDNQLVGDRRQEVPGVPEVRRPDVAQVENKGAGRVPVHFPKV